MRSIVKLGFVVLPFFGCFASGDKPQTYVISELLIPTFDDESSSRDIDGDGDLDNSLIAWDNLAYLMGIDTQALLTERVSSGEFLFGIDFRESKSGAEFSMFRAISGAPPRFDGSDQILSTGEEFSFTDVIFDKQSIFDSGDNSLIKARGATLDWLLFPFGVGDLLTVPLRDSHVDASVVDNASEVDDFTLEGKITGHINIFDAALALERTPAVFDSILASESVEFGGGAAIPCESNSGDAQACNAISPDSFCSDRIEDQDVTGVCIAFGSISRRLLQFLDLNNDGRYSVDFDEASGLFLENELDLMIELPPNSSPRGLIGNMFTLDLNQDGFTDSMPVGVQFTAIRANQEQ